MRIGSLFSGYEGLGMGVQAVLGGDIAWVSDIDPGACKILAHRYPDVPNIGDITTVDWSTVEPVDVLTGGSPCQDVSAAGKRAGMRPGTRSGLWASMCDAIDIIRPSLVVWENVRGVLSAGADSAVEPCPVCVGDERESHLRALGRVVGDLAELGYVGRWTGLRAADVGAPHGRFRVFLTAWPAGYASSADGVDEREVGSQVPARRAGWDFAAYSDSLGHERSRRARDGRAGSADGAVTATDTDGHALREQPVSFARRGGATVTGHVGADLATDPARIGWSGRQQPRMDVEQDGSEPAHIGAPRRTAVDWGQYGPAIERWERCLGRAAPAPTELSPKGGPRLSPRFVEWMQGLPAGWVTDVPGLTRNEQLKALGNGVVPQQCAAALRLLLPDVSEAVA